GWKSSMPQSNVADRKLPAPDRPPSFDYKPWPAVSLPPYHYSVADIGAPPQAAGAAPAPSSPAEERRRLALLAGKIQRLDDQRQIEILQRTYGYYVDKNLWKEIASLYTDDGTLEIGGRGVFVGRARALQYLEWLGRPKEGLLYDHT